MGGTLKLTVLTYPSFIPLNNAREEIDRKILYISALKGPSLYISQFGIAPPFLFLVCCTMQLKRPARSATLCSLSNELILLILSNFCLHCRQGPHETPQVYFPATGQRRDEPSWYALDILALHSMSLVSRRLSPLAQEILYHEFIPGYGDSWYADAYDFDWRLAKFLRAVARNRDRAASVKRLHINVNLLTGISRDSAEAVLQDAAQVRGIDASAFIRPFRDLRHPFSPDQYRPFGDELLGLLLACLPHLKTLSFTAGASLQGIPASALRTAGVSTLPIETLEIMCCIESLGSRLDGIVELASSTIRNLYIDICDGVGLSLLNRRGYFPNLRNLCIANSRLSGSDLSSFLSRYGNLVTFSYESVMRDDDFLLSDAVAQLIRNKETLQTLHLDISPLQHTPGGNGRSPTELLASLNSFPVLRNLLLSSRLLYHGAVDSADEDASVLTRLLPRSIVSLQVMVADNMETQGVLPRLATGLVHLAQAVSQGQFRNLKSVSCITEQRLDGYDLDAMFAVAGADFGYDGWQFNDKMPGRRSGFRLGSLARSITPVSSDDETDS
ncbi:uncharacterized protein P884DRAFT_5386 [Thermothelomyces heterothallicus CBS 202.75]|uniref:uncharacterized protein n=1 Tax=Thermothelomyces heterothallicus CBS 202.75 TaxID=1149848 RepID=UPI003742D1A6